MSGAIHGRENHVAVVLVVKEPEEEKEATAVIPAIVLQAALADHTLHRNHQVHLQQRVASALNRNDQKSEFQQENRLELGAVALLLSDVIRHQVCFH